MLDDDYCVDWVEKTVNLCSWLLVWKVPLGAAAIPTLKSCTAPGPIYSIQIMPSPVNSDNQRDGHNSSEDEESSEDDEPLFKFPSRGKRSMRWMIWVLWSYDRLKRHTRPRTLIARWPGR